jgi:hypothetical protein
LKDLPTPRNDAMNQPARIHLSQLSDGRLCVYSGSIFGGSRFDASPHSFRARLSAAKTPEEKSEILALSRRTGAAELGAKMGRDAGWTR